jgi:hypothetical protein
MKATTKALKTLAKSAYPDYTGRKVFFEVATNEIDCTSWWDGGTRDYFRFVRADGKIASCPELSPYRQMASNMKISLVPGICCVRHSFFCGHDCGLTVLFHPSDMPKMIENNLIKD